MDLANWALRTSPKITTGVKIISVPFGFLTRSDIRKSHHPSPPSSHFNIPNYVRRRIQSMSLSFCNFLYSHLISSLLAPNIFLSTYCLYLGTLFSNTLNPCSSLKMRDQVSQPYNTTGNIIILYVLTFSFLESRQDDKIGDYLPTVAQVKVLCAHSL